MKGFIIFSSPMVVGMVGELSERIFWERGRSSSKIIVESLNVVLPQPTLTFSEHVHC